MKLTVCRMPGMPTAGQRASFRSVVLEAMDGMSESDKKAWRALWAKLLSAEPGELLDITYTFPRNPKFHRKFFALITVGFEGWDPAKGRKRLKHHGQTILKDLDAFRKDLIILAGFYVARYTIDGKLELDAKSMAFANMDEMEFDDLYQKVLTVLLEKVLKRYTRADVNEQVDRILAFAS